MTKPSLSAKKVSIPEMKEALGRSGYPLESRIERILKSTGYDVETNWTYPDPETKKVRELDLFADSHQWVDRGGEVYHSVGYELFIECVNNPQPVAFFSREDRTAKYNGGSISLWGKPSVARAKSGKTKRIADLIEMADFHRYFGPKHATQYCSFAQKKGSGEWMALHEDDHFLTFKKLDDAMWYRWDQADEEELDPEDGAVTLRFMYPVVVLQGDLLEINAASRKITPRSTGHVRFTQTVIHEDEQYASHIDVVTERSFRRFMRMLDDEFDEIYRRVYSQLDSLVAAVKDRNLVEDED